jgi:hypothetical protein
VAWPVKATISPPRYRCVSRTSLLPLSAPLPRPAAPHEPYMNAQSSGTWSDVKDSVVGRRPLLFSTKRGTKSEKMRRASGIALSAARFVREQVHSAVHCLRNHQCEESSKIPVKIARGASVCARP